MTGVMFRPLDPLELLRRRDKHYLAAGDGILHAPPHPRWLDRPGFWDGGQIFLYPIEPLFTLTFVERDGNERALRRMHREWTPAELTVSYSTGGLELEERRSVLPGGRFVSEFRVTNGLADPVELTVVAWTAQDGRAVTARSTVGADAQGISFCRTASDRAGEIGLLCVLRFEGEPAEGWAIYESEDAGDRLPLPEWAATPFRDRWAGPVLRGERRLAPLPAPDPRLVYGGISRRLRLGSGEADSFTVTMQVTPLEPSLRPLTPQAPAPLPGRGASQSRTSWQQYFAAAPALNSSDPFLERVFPYRWYALRLAAIDPVGQYAYPTTAEGIEGRHHPSADTAWAQIRDLRWLADPARAQGTLRGFLAHQDESGALPASLFLDRRVPGAISLADWGGSLLAIDEVHPDDSFLAACYGGLCRYATFVDRQHDPEESSLVTAWDEEGGLRRKSVALTVYHYRLRRSLARAAARLGRAEESRAHDGAADRIGDAVRKRLWDPAAEMFVDQDAGTMRPAGEKSATCFYPYLTDLAGPEHLAGLERHLFNRAEFWTACPVPSLAADQRGYNPDGDVEGIRRSRPGNGRVWPAVNCHIAEALGRVALALDPRYRSRVGEFLQRFFRMMFFEADPARPNSFEHYSPETGWPSVYRGLDDLPQGWINDLIIRFVAGVRPEGSRLVIDPLPCGVERLKLDRLPFRGRRVGVALAGGSVKVSVDGAVTAEGPLGGVLTVAF